jgi:hypothetical protein
MRPRHVTTESADALRAKYAALRTRVIKAPNVAGLFVSEMKAPVRLVSSLRFIAREEGFVTLGQLVERAATLGVVPFDVEPGVTLSRTVEFLLDRALPSAAVAFGAFPDSRPQATTERPKEPEDERDVRDSFDELNEAIDELQSAMAQRGTSRWVADVINQHAARLRCPLRKPFPGVSSSACFELAIRSLRRAKTGMDANQGQLLADLTDAMSLFGARDSRVARAMMGFEGPHATLEEVGLREGVTRERIRQLYNRFQSRAHSWRPPLVSLALLQGAMDRAGRIVTEFELHSALPPGVLSSVEELRVLEGLLRVGWLGGLASSRYPGVWVRSPTEIPTLEEMVTRVRQKARRSLNKFGALDLVEYEDLVGDDGPGLVYSLMLQTRPFDVIEGWAVLRAPQSTVMANRARRIAEVTPALSLTRLRRALKKSLRWVPPDSVWMRALQRDVPTTTCVGDDLVAFPGASSGHLSGSEALARRIIKERGGATTLRDLQRSFVREGMSAGSAGVAFSRSPVLERYAPGVVGLIGGGADATRIAELRRVLRKDSVRSLVGFRRVNGTVEVLYKLDPALVSSTLFLLPRGVIGLGEWTMENTSGRVVVKKSYVSGLHRVAKQCVDSGARRMAVVFRPEARTIHVAAR